MSNIRHNMRHTRQYTIWKHIKSRCFNKNVPYYKDYGGRGITCEWTCFEDFWNDMKDTYQDNLTIDRINNHGNYSKENCRWATMKVQANNTRNIEKAQKFNFNGIDYTVTQLAEMFNFKRSTLSMRLQHYGWSLDKALNTKVLWN